MQGLATGQGLVWVLLIVVPFFIVIFEPSWLVKYYLIFGAILSFYFIGMILNDEGARKEFPKGWTSLLYFPLSFIFWYLVRKIVRKKK